MARSAVTVTKLTGYNALGAVTADAIDLTNDHEIDISGLKDGKLCILIAETENLPLVVTVKAGVYTGGAKDLVLAAFQNSTKAITLESSRFKNADEKILIDLSSTGAAAGTITAVHLPD